MKQMAFFMILVMVLAMALPGAGFSAQLEWDKNPDASTYQVYSRVAGTDADWEPLGDPVDGTVLELPDMPEFNRDYEFAVQAFNECGNSSDYSEAVSYNPCMKAIVEAVGNVRITFQITFESGGQ